VGLRGGLGEVLEEELELVRDAIDVRGEVRLGGGQGRDVAVARADRGGDAALEA
jgi:hypothetical protein